jgi:cytochrome c biogenesis protein CcdA
VRLSGGAGGAIVQAFTNQRTVLTVSAVVYTLVGTFALAYGLVEFGFVKLPVPGLHGHVPGFVQKLGYYPRSFVLGLVVGGGFTVSCPFPTNHVILGWIAVTGSVVVGALVLGLYDVGRAFPVFVVGLLLFARVKPQIVTRWIRNNQEVIHQINCLGLTLFAAFMLTSSGACCSPCASWSRYPHQRFKGRPRPLAGAADCNGLSTLRWCADNDPPAAARLPDADLPRAGYHGPPGGVHAPPCSVDTAIRLDGEVVFTTAPTQADLRQELDRRTRPARGRT